MSLHSCRWTIEALGFDLETIVEHYKSWVVVPFYVVVSGLNEYEDKYEYACFRSPKRGDKKYSQKVLRRFNDLRKQLPKESFFFWGERDRNKIRSSARE